MSGTNGPQPPPDLAPTAARALLAAKPRANALGLADDRCSATPPMLHVASRAKACAPIRCRSRQSGYVPCPWCRKSPASLGRRTESIGDPLLNAAIPSNGWVNVLLPGVTAGPQTVSICCVVKSDTNSRQARGAGLLCTLLAVSIERLCCTAWLGPVILATARDRAERHSNCD